MGPLTRQDCKTLTDPAARLTCYDKVNPPVATYPIPLPKPSRPIPLTRPDGTPGTAETSDNAEDCDASRENELDLPRLLKAAEAHYLL